MTKRKIQDETRWHLDKRVPIALIVSMGIQTAAAVWWASSVSERVSTLERRADIAAPQGDRLTRVEVKIENVQEGVNRIERALTLKDLK